VIVDDKGHILTNNHVVGDADEVRVRVHGVEHDFTAQVVGADPRTDLAVIRIKASDLKPAKLGDSDTLRIGEWVIAAGNPFGLENTITAGIVSAKGRSIMGGGQYEDFIQTDAAINPGNSGGPLVNLRGEVVGINTAIFSRSGGYMGIGFAIPINMAKNVMQSLITRGKVVRGWIGVGIQNLTEDLARSFNYADTQGALVGQIEPDSPADKAGLKQGDIIVKVGDSKIKDINQLRNLVASFSPGDKVDIDLVRSGRKETVTVKVGELPAQSGEMKQPEEPDADLGLSVEDLTPELSRRLGGKTAAGVIVRAVRPGGVGARAGLQPRDIITKVGDKKVSSADDFYDAVKHADLKKGLRLVVVTEGMERFIFLRDSEE
jgi:serine protease Do